MQGAAAPNPSTSIDLDLETLIGTATAPGTLIADPFDARRYVHGAGATVVLSSFARPRPQLLLDGCAEPVSAIAQSRSGVHLAAGEEGHDADITVWSANSVTGAWSKLYKFEEHDNSVHSLSFSHDERLLASVGGDNRIIVWDMATGMIVSQVDVSSEGGKASAATKGAARQGSMQQPGAQAGCCIEAVLFGGLTQDVSGAFTSSYMLASAGRNGHLKVWSLNPFTGELTGTAIKLGAATRNFACLAFSEDGDRLFAGTRSGDVYLVNTRSAKLANIVPVRRAGVTSICVGYRGVRAAPFGSSARSNGEFICVGGDDGAFSCWAHKRDAFGRAEPAFVQTMNVPPSDALVGAITSLSFLGWGCEGGRDDPTKILVGSSRGYVKVISLESDGAGVDGDEAEKEAARAYAALLGAPDDGSRSGGPNDDRVTFISESHCGPVASCAMMGGEHFVTAACDSSLRLWSMNDFSVPVKVQVHDCGVPTGGIAATADKVFSGWSDGRIRAHLTGTDPAAAAGVVAGSGNPAETGEAPLLWAIDEAHKEGVGAICLSHNERFLLSGGAQGEVRMWEMGSRSMVSHLKEHRTRVTGLCLYDTDKHALSCSRDRSFLCWDLTMEKRIASRTLSHSGISGVALSQDEKLVLTAGQDGALHVWDLREREAVFVLNGAHEGECSCVAVPPRFGSTARRTDTFVATAGLDEVVRLWDLRSVSSAPGASAQSLMQLGGGAGAASQVQAGLVSTGFGHSKRIGSLCFSPDGSRLVSTGDDCNICIWNTTSI